MTCLEMALGDGISRDILQIDLWRRSAKLYQAAGALLKAAEAWLNAGDKNMAAELFSAADDDFRAAELFYECGRFPDAVTSAECCLEKLADKYFSRRVAMRLVAAAALIKLGDNRAANIFIREVRVGLSELIVDCPMSLSQAGPAWESLARFGVRVERPDLVRLGYEKAMLIYGSALNLQRLRCAGDYLEVVADDKILASDLRSRIAEFKSDLKL